MPTKTRKNQKGDKYFDLVLQYPLRHIRSDEELDRAIVMVDSLIDRDDLAPGEQDYLDVLSDIIEVYETNEHPIAPVSDGAMLRHLLEAKGVSQADVSRETEIAESTISEVLAGKRSLSRGHIGKLSRFFNVKPGVFNF